jgi:serine/threonine-protein kinase
MEAVAPDRRLAGRYLVEEPLAAGGMATVWRARDEVLARTVAVKVLRTDLSDDADFRERFEREAVASARLTHPSIVSIYDTGVDDGTPYIVMEYLEGGTLGDLLRRRGPLDPMTATSLIVPVLGALEFAHQHGVVHRDVKPANVLVSPDGRVKVTDFGIAKAAFGGTDLTTTGVLLGTVQYIAPEQVHSDQADARSDVYSTGVVLYELLTGRPPFKADTPIATAMMRLTTDPVRPRDIRPDIARSLEAVVCKAMARSPEDRYQTAQAMQTALQRGVPDTGGHTRDPATRPTAAISRRLAPAPGRRPAPPSVFRSWLLVPLLIVVLAAALIAGGLAFGRLELGGPLGVRGVDSSPAPGEGTRVRVARVQDVDPQGDDHAENSDDAPLAVDGDPSTEWRTDHYSSSSFGNLKEGLGLWLDLGGSVEVTRVVVTTSVPGWSFELIPASTPQVGPEPLEASSGARTFAVPSSGRAVVEVRPVTTRGLLVWITSLGPDGGDFAASIAEVRVIGTPA